MAAVDDIRKESDKAIDVIDKKIKHAGDLGIAGEAGVPNHLTALAQEKADIAERAALEMLESEDLAGALEAIRSATKDMTTTAAKMVSLTTFLSFAANLTNSANKVATALKNITKSA